MRREYHLLQLLLRYAYMYVCIKLHICSYTCAQVYACKLLSKNGFARTTYCNFWCGIHINRYRWIYRIGINVFKL